jgi:hypothetical protein
VAGITSYVTDRACSLLACSTKVDAFTDYIQAFIEADGQKGDACQDDLECLTGHCTDGVCCDYACESLCETCNQAGSIGTCARNTGPDAPDECRLDDGGCASTGDDGGGLFAGILILLSLAWLVDAVRRKAWRAPRSGPRQKE